MSVSHKHIHRRGSFTTRRERRPVRCPSDRGMSSISPPSQVESSECGPPSRSLQTQRDWGRSLFNQRRFGTASPTVSQCEGAVCSERLTPPLSNKLMRLISLLSSILGTSSHPTWSWAPGAAVWSTGWQHKAQQRVPTPAPSPSPQRRKPHRQTAHRAPTTTACPERSWTPLLG